MDYSDAGVDIDASERAVRAIAREIDLDEGGYAGLMDFGDYVLGMTTDGVGTKILVAEALGDYSSIGIDCIAMNVNDLIAMNLEPAGFVDYIVVEEPDEEVFSELGRGLREGASQAGVSVLGGETAVMPEVVRGIDLAGSALGVARQGEVIDGSDVVVGDSVVALPSNGVHSNGLTLARKAVSREYDLRDEYPYGDGLIAEELLRPTAIYVDVLDAVREFEVHGLCHVTGGGFLNLARVSGHRFVIDDPPSIPSVFEFIRDLGDVDMDEMYRTFNMGMGFAVITDKGDADDVADYLGGSVVGEVVEGDGVVIDEMELG